MELLANPEKRPPNFRQPTGGLSHPYPSKGFPHLDGGNPSDPRTGVSLFKPRKLQRPGPRTGHQHFWRRGRTIFGETAGTRFSTS